MCHLRDNVLVQYVTGQTSCDEGLEIDTHLAECSACVERVCALRYLQEDFAELWDSWTAAEHGRLHRQWEFAKALGEIAAARPPLRSRIREWLDALKAEAEVGLKVLLDRSHEVASLAQGILPSSYEFKLCPAYTGVGSPEKQKALEDHLTKSSMLLAGNREAEAIEELLAAVKIDPRCPQAATSEVFCQGRRILQTAVDSRRRTVWIKFWPPEGQSPPALAVLLPLGREGKALVAEFEPVEEDASVLAEFRDIPDGQHALRIGPSSGRR